MGSASDLHHMRRALALAADAADAGEVPVGAVIVDPATDEIVAEGANGLTGLTLYVTLEPCAMCAGAISHARIGRVIWGADDAKGGGVIHGARVFDQPTCHWKPEVQGGVLADNAAELLRSFFRARRTRGTALEPER